MLAGKGALVVLGVGKERALLTAVAPLHTLAVVDSETAGFGLVNSGVALAVIDVRAEGFQICLDAFLRWLNSVGVAVLAD
ncbi:hypothetical protein C451_04491 [Halococcus thailandensis JCM 13552]|uniref:Uncharacterized protein n=1 Tax=Halococcus thailandensis JCM 13552 TaxID=1227457 RepID=M0NHC5_9EURY|nr:hypothetical protein C451_04491 [Halococcus thailandensis JCM 13552]